MGTFRKGGSATATFGVPFNNTGTVEVHTGTLKFMGGGTSNGTFHVASGAFMGFSGLHDFGVGTQFTGSGVASLDGGRILVEGATDIECDFRVVGGSFQVTATTTTSGDFGIASGQLWVSDTLSITSGTLDWQDGGEINGLSSGSIDIGPSGTLAIGGDADKYLYTMTINHGGTGTWTGTGPVFARYDATFNILEGGVLEVQNDANFGFSDNETWADFNNAGTLRKTAGAGTTTFNKAVAFNNTGTVEVETGTLAFQGTFIQTAGATRLSGGTIAAARGLNIQGGQLVGSGQIDGNVFIAGLLSPGYSPGTLFIDGDYVQASDGMMLIELTGSESGEYDVLDVSGTGSLGGTFEIRLIDGFIPTNGDTFEILSFGSRSGEFGTVIGQHFGGVGHFDLQYNAHGLTLVAQAIPEPSTLLMGFSAGIFLFLLAWRRRNHGRNDTW